MVGLDFNIIVNLLLAITLRDIISHNFNLKLGSRLRFLGPKYDDRECILKTTPFVLLKIVTQDNPTLLRAVRGPVHLFILEE